ncbi:Angiotensin-converting enzyme [Hypsibius exemplaris]|uniref:Angiotensin-converting enzyme n=1 Tax=Hypsibius exemplaris TaxID=2072580 RepID=A0A1W0WTY3_HYPEX|nr:Angiotensin-converting enzyme [Hypsibius exemplaris]
MVRGCCWRNTSVVFLLGIVCLLLGPAKGKFTPVDISPLERYHLDETKLTSAKYFRSWLANVYNPIGQKMAQSAVQASWDYNTNITAVNEAATIESSQASANLTRLVAKIAAKFDLSKSRDTRMKTTQKKMKELGDASLDPAELTELVKIVNGMESVYSTAKICFDPNAHVNKASLENPTNCAESKKLPFDPDLINFMKNSTWDAKKRRYVWKAWRDVSGKKVRKDYIRYIQLKNKAAKLTGYNDNGQYWRSEYTDENAGYTDSDFLKDLDDLWLQIKPLYGEMHAYVRRKLINKLPHEHLSPTGPIPGHLIGDMFSQEWTSMLDFTQLFPAKPLLDVTDEMKRQNYTVDKMFHLSEQFQNELGLKPMPETFWKKSLFVKPKDGREVVCHASAWDFYRTGDVRIKMCTEVNMDDLITIHHEMGHIQYFLQYADQMMVFRGGANSGFHEAESDLNYMFSTALDKIAFLPFAYIMDRYRYDVFSGKIGTNELNSGCVTLISRKSGRTFEFNVVAGRIPALASRNGKNYRFTRHGRRALLEFFQPMTDYLKAENRRRRTWLAGEGAAENQQGVLPVMAAPTCNPSEANGQAVEEGYWELNTTLYAANEAAT